ncbi:plasmid mobilization relaxosome protein MobC [Pedobacter sp. HMWF019]|uniref:plasmid mobilization protein n=1 Tax=Pedobacter sp. HMWF019 TaxID=2056856 RepID=UPI0018EE4D16|nr:plasmid mobilization relaxosome protein MobC [Pedobacter sp. HMWF019]
MSKKNLNRTRIIGLRLSPEEYQSLTEKWETSNCRRLSDYARKKLFDRAIIKSYRNKSLDDFMLEMIEVRKGLERALIGFEQSVKKLYVMDKKADVLTWIRLHDLEKKTLLIKVEEIKQKINKIADQWLQ